MPKEPVAIAGFPTVPCSVCTKPTDMTSTQLCGPCWELKQRLENYLPLLLANPDAARNARRLVLGALAKGWTPEAAPAAAELPKGFFHFMRDAAAACTRGPWQLSEKATDALVADPALCPDNDGHLAHYGGSLVAESMQPSDRRYVALMNPSNGLAIAALMLRAEASSLTLEQARIIRSWSVELECSNARVAELFDGLWGGGTDLGRGDEICAEARRVLAEAW